MRISDWSSDVCSSDLQLEADAVDRLQRQVAAGEDAADAHVEVHLEVAHRKQRLAHAGDPPLRAGACRRSRWQAFSRSFPENRSEEHTSELQSLMRISYAVFCLKKKTH